jgi:hypothetical protein
MIHLARESFLSMRDSAIGFKARTIDGRGRGFGPQIEVVDQAGEPKTGLLLLSLLVAQESAAKVSLLGVDRLLPLIHETLQYASSEHQPVWTTLDDFVRTI